MFSQYYIHLSYFTKDTYMYLIKLSLSFFFTDLVTWLVNKLELGYSTSYIVWRTIAMNTVPDSAYEHVTIEYLIMINVLVRNGHKLGCKCIRDNSTKANSTSSLLKFHWNLQNLHFSFSKAAAFDIKSKLIAHKDPRQHLQIPCHFPQGKKHLNCLTIH